MTVTLTARVDRLDWSALATELDDIGHAVTPPLLTAEECRRVAAWFDEPERFRSTVDMARHRFGEGRYRYFADPLPAEVAELRAAFYPRLAPVANRWAEQLGGDERWPLALTALRDLCAAAGQKRPTPLILRYDAGGYNCLHQDLYGDVWFPLQVVIGLDEPGADFTGGEVLLVEQRPRAQSRGEAITLQQGQAMVFPTRHRPALGARGYHRVQVRHGASRIRSGRRHALGLIFHDAR